jgi:HEAT repeat protein
MEDLNDFGEGDASLEFYDVGMLALEDPDSIVRLFGVRVLDDYEADELLPVFLRMLTSDPAVEVRAAAATALSSYVYLGELEEIDLKDYKKVEDALLAVHQGTDEVLVRRRALEALGFSSNPEVTDLIQAAYDSGDPEWLISALFAMGRSYNEIWIPNVLAMLGDERPAVRAEAAEAAGELEIKKAREPLLQMLKDPDEEVRAATIWSLSQVGGDDVREWLETLLEETEDDEEADLIEQALENLEFNEEFNLELMEFDEGETPADIDDEDLESGISRNGHDN